MRFEHEVWQKHVLDCQVGLGDWANLSNFFLKCDFVSSCFCPTHGFGRSEMVREPIQDNRFVCGGRNSDFLVVTRSTQLKNTHPMKIGRYVFFLE